MTRVQALRAAGAESPLYWKFAECRVGIDRLRDKLPPTEASLPLLDAWSRAIQGILDGIRSQDEQLIRRSLADADLLTASDRRSLALQAARGARGRRVGTVLADLEEQLAALGPDEAEVGPRTEEAEDGVRAVAELEAAIGAGTGSYVRTTPFVCVETGGAPVLLTIKDILLLGAISGSDVLLLGRTGTGKTKLATKVMEALFGPEGFYAKTTLPSMSPTDFMDVDFPAIKAGRKTLKEAIQGVPALTRPGIVINEANRAPALVQAMLIPFLDREFEIEGVPVDVGVHHGAEWYQYRILTINEGGQYAVEEMDRAIRDRMAIEVPVDLFPQTAADTLGMLSGLPKSTAVVAPEDHRAAVLRAYDAVRRIPVPSPSRGFIAYLAGLGNCVRSISGTKEGIAFSPEICAGCRHAKHFFSNLCGSIRAPSPRALVNLQRVAQGIALIRAARTGTSGVTVGLEDVKAAAPMVLLNKLELDPIWLQTAGPTGKEFRGCVWLAIQAVFDFVFTRYVHFAGSCGPAFEKYVSGVPLDPADYDCLEAYARNEDAWGVNLVELGRGRRCGAFGQAPAAGTDGGGRTG